MTIARMINCEDESEPVPVRQTISSSTYVSRLSENQVNPSMIRILMIIVVANG